MRCLASTLSLTVMFGLGILLTPSIVRAESATEVVDKLEKKAATVQTVYMALRTNSEENKEKRQNTLKIWRKKAGDKWKYRMISTSEPSDKDKKPMTTLFDGQFEWREVALGEKNMVFKSKASDTTPNDYVEIKQRLKNGEAKIKDKEKVEGHSCTVIEINGTENGARFQATYWISEEHGLVLRSRSERADRYKTESVVTEIKVNESIPDSEFTYTPSPGATVVDTDSMAPPPKTEEKPKKGE